MNQDRFPLNGTDRIVFAEDAISWLESATMLENCSLVTSLPDFTEFPKLTLLEWKQWFIKVSELVLSRTPDFGVTIFFQSDIKVEGAWVDKGYLCQKAAEQCGSQLLWHKIYCRIPPGQISFGRPSYSHLLCFSRGARADISRSGADVVSSVGEKIWERGMGLDACMTVAKFILEQTQTKTIVNPFCGHGSMLAAANWHGLKAIGIERSLKRAEKARQLTLDTDGKTWCP